MKYILISEEKDGYYTYYVLFNKETKQFENLVLNPKGEKVFTFKKS